MLDEKDLQAIGQLMAQQRKEILHDVKVLLDTEVQTKFNLLAGGKKTILETLAPKSRVDDLEDEVKFLKSMMRQMYEDLQKLKKAD